MTDFPVRRVDRSARIAVETLGSKPKFWFREGDRRFLFKAEERGTGEDWAEVIASRLCVLLGVPHVDYALARQYEGPRDRGPGVVCENMAPPPDALVLGNEMLLARDPHYPKLQRFKVREHTVEAVRDVISTLAPPPDAYLAGAPAGVKSALDVFTGYVMLDAWIANQDRHHENWGVLLAGKMLYLAPTFDHGASLARNLIEKERSDRLTTHDRGRGIAQFVRRARSAFYADATARRPLTTFEAWRAFAARAPNAESIWLARLAAIDEPTISGLLDEVPPHRMTRISRDFTTALLAENRRRLLANEDE